MKKSISKIQLVAVLATLALTGCATKNMAPEPVAAPAVAPVVPVEVAAPEPAPAPAPTFVLKDVNFDFDESTLKPSAAAILDRVAAALDKQRGVGYQIAGFTDSIGSDAYNQSLSQRRADAVRDYLMAHGVGAAQLTTRGYGETNHIAGNDTAAGRAQNRRVEVRPMT